MQIFDAFGPVVSGLGSGVANPFQDRKKRHGNAVSQNLGEERGLVKAALAFARGMERDWHDHVETAAAQPRIIQRFAKPFRERVTKMALPAVLEVVDELANEAAAAISGDSGVEMQKTMRAIRATERLRDRAKKRLGTFRAEWRADTRRPALARSA